MYTTLYSNNTNIDIEALKHSLESVAFVVLSITPGPQGLESRTVVILDGTLTGPEIIQAQGIIDNHTNSKDPTTLPITSSVNIANNLEVDGTQTILHTTEVDVEDNMIDLNTSATVPLQVLSGLRAKRSLAGGDSAIIAYDERAAQTHAWKAGVEPNLYELITTNNISNYLTNIPRSNIATGGLNRVLFNNSSTGALSESDNFRWFNSTLQLYLASGSNVFFNSLGKISSTDDNRRIEFKTTALELNHDAQVSLLYGGTEKLRVAANMSVRSGDFSVTAGAISASGNISTTTGTVSGNILSATTSIGAPVISSSNTLSVQNDFTVQAGNIRFASTGQRINIASGGTLSLSVGTINNDILYVNGSSVGINQSLIFSNSLVGSIRSSRGTWTNESDQGAAIYLGGDNGTVNIDSATALIEASTGAAKNMPQICIGVLKDLATSHLHINANILMYYDGNLYLRTGDITRFAVNTTNINTYLPLQVNNGVTLYGGLYQGDTSDITLFGALKIYSNSFYILNGSPGAPGPNILTCMPEGLTPYVFRTSAPTRLDADVQIGGGLTITGGGLAVNAGGATVSNGVLRSTNLGAVIEGTQNYYGSFPSTILCNSVLRVTNPSESAKHNTAGGGAPEAGESRIILDINTVGNNGNPYGGPGWHRWTIYASTSSDGGPHLCFAFDGNLRATLDTDGNWLKNDTNPLT